MFGQSSQEETSDEGEETTDSYDVEKLQEGFWALSFILPKVKSLIEEGADIRDRVDESVQITPVGAVSMHYDEGYIFIPDWEQNVLRVVRYWRSVSIQCNTNYCKLETEPIKSIPYPGGVLPALTGVKQDLITEHDDLPSPATFGVTVDAEAPFEETLLPVIERKFMNHLDGME